MNPICLSNVLLSRRNAKLVEILFIYYLDPFGDRTYRCNDI
jgi:hypothetical protein